MTAFSRWPDMEALKELKAREGKAKALGVQKPLEDREGCRIPYRYIHKEFGGICLFGECSSKQDRVPSIGTLECFNGVAIYVPIDAYACFFAHINAPYEHGNGDSYEPTLLGETKRAKRVPRRVVDRMRLNWLDKWTDEALEYIASGKGTPIVICPTESDKDSTGSLVFEGLKAFFTKLNLEQYLVPEMQGFIVNHCTGETDFFKHDDDGFNEAGVLKADGKPRRCIDEYVRTEEHKATHQWRIGIRQYRLA